MHSVMSAQSQDSAGSTDRTQVSPESNGSTQPVNPFYPSRLKDDDSKYELEPGADPDNHLIVPFVKHLAGDQYAFWTAPAHFHFKDLEWIAPFVGVTAGFIAGDSWISKQIPLGQVNHSKTFSDYATYSLLGAGAGSFLLGHLKGDDHMAEAGLLSGEAAINSTAITYLLRNIAQRQRPYQTDGNGAFFANGTSFPSEHSAIAWSIASVMAHEYPGTLTKILAYGLATGISATRVTGQQHFASDVIVGGALGWYFGRQVYRAHHDSDLGGDSWGSVLPESSNETSSEKTRDPENMGSPDVPLDSWVYPALERLIALGYIKTGYLGIRPWTRMACAQMLEEVQERIGDEDAPNQSSANRGSANQGSANDEALRIYKDLSEEFAPENSRLDGAANVGASLDSIYSRVTQISGPPLRDGYHFGQTIINDYGRPYGEGFNSVGGVTAHAEAGPFAIDFRGEYQHAPSVTSYSSQVLSAMSVADAAPPLPDGSPATDRVQLLEGTASLTVKDVQFSFGRQSQWLGPGESGPLLMSNNAPPFVAFKIDQISPEYIPGFSKIFGPVRTEFFIGQLDGQHWEHCTVPSCQSYPGYPGVVGPNISPQPFIHGAAFSFKPTDNLEVGFTYDAMFGGPGLPVTFGTFLHTYYVHSNNLGLNPGKRASSANFTYRVPGLRDWVTLYLDSMTWDEISPIGSTRANVNPGIFMPKIPMLPKLQFRAEGFNISRTKEFPIGWVYFNGDRYLSGYTNDGDLLGSWIGRAGRGGQVWLTYSLSPRSSLQLGYRLETVAPNFIGGGRLADYSGKGEFVLWRDVSASALVQYEQWNFPILSAQAQSNVTASVEIDFHPHWFLQRSAE